MFGSVTCTVTGKKKKIPCEECDVP
jgi:hypothetical protein